jgi:hypothetical protein
MPYLNYCILQGRLGCAPEEIEPLDGPTLGFSFAYQYRANTRASWIQCWATKATMRNIAERPYAKGDFVTVVGRLVRHKKRERNLELHVFEMYLLAGSKNEPPGREWEAPDWEIEPEAPF